MENTIFIHGLESSGEGFKGNFFRKKIPQILTPTFKAFEPTKSISKLLNERMSQLKSILKEKNAWLLIGSSFGGLMASLYALKNPNKVKKIILLAPYLIYEGINPNQFSQIKIPVKIFHGKNDEIIPVKQNKEIAKTWFQNLDYKIVDDDHMLHKTVKSLNWVKLIKT
ncbi:MAG: Alpha/beta hydrolase family protein [Promethearchaeota archaeon]|nr:MAG: Alpha/beta hydrolase family protein [Candidatus Lokiarchaeota archaeon]